MIKFLLYGKFFNKNLNKICFIHKYVFSALLKKYPFMDPTRVGIWGWVSYLLYCIVNKKTN